VIVHTGQHYDDNMSQVFFDDLEIHKPKYNLGIGGGTHGENTGRMIEAIEAIVFKEKPDWVVVYGDTDSTLAGALAAVKLHIPVAHVEAGLRSFNRKMPEEINRVLTDHASDLLLAPTVIAVENLRKEGIGQMQIENTGDVMYDAALFYAAKAKKSSRILEQLSLQPRKYILATVHRAENTDDQSKLETIMAALSHVSRDTPVILPMHPRTRKKIATANISPHSSLTIIDPVGYLDMVMLEKHAAAIATDSGGVQKEAFFHKVPCVTLRNETEWVELLKLGWNRLAFPNSFDQIVGAIQDSMTSMPETDAHPYGSGDSAGLIVDILSRHCMRRQKSPI
jgi:UDP-GlcNAc3NAcA epimerase